MAQDDSGVYSEKFGEKFQEHILAVMARSPGFMRQYRTALDHTYFSSKLHRMVARALLEHIDEFDCLPSKDLLVEASKEHGSDEDTPHLEKAVGKLYKRNIDDAPAVVKKAVEFGKQQAMINAVMDSADDIDHGSREKVLPRIQEAMLVGEDILDVGVDYKGAVENRMQRYLNPQLKYEGKIPTGIPHLDMALKGGLRRGELGVILAPPKRGKSLFLVNMGFGALTNVYGYNVVHYSLEMHEEEIGERYDDRLAGKAIKFKETDPHKYTEILKDKTGKFIFGNLFIKDYPTRSAGVSTIRAHLSLLASQGFRPDLIIVDYGDIMKAERRLTDMRHMQAGIYEDLRTLADDYYAAVWTGSQASKGALEKEVITIGDFAEAFEKAAIVDVALAFCESPDEFIDRKGRIFLAGVRNAEDGRTVECDILRDRCLIRSHGLYDASYMKVAKPKTEENGGGGNGSKDKSVAKLKAGAGISKPQKKVIGGKHKKVIGQKPKNKDKPSKKVILA